MTMLDALLAAGLRLAEALGAENEALAAMDLERAAGLAKGKVQASDAFAAAYAAAAKTGARATDGPTRQMAQDLTRRLESLGSENRRLLQRAIAVQSQVIETIASAARAGSGGAGYAASGRRAMPRQAQALALATRA
jgi:hypothetical protein